VYTKSAGDVYTFSYNNGSITTVPDVTYFNKVSSSSDGDVADNFIEYTLYHLKKIGINKQFNQVSNIKSYKTNLLASMNSGMNEIMKGSNTLGGVTTTNINTICNTIYNNMLTDSSTTTTKRLIPDSPNATTGTFKLIKGDILELKLNLTPGNHLISLDSSSSTQTYNLNVVLI
jgi:hypothetical protein